MEITFWKDKDSGKIDPELYSTHAEALAQKMADDNNRSRRVNKRTQIRKFYDEVVRLDAITTARSGEWDNVAPLVHMLVAKAAYANGRDLVSKGFADFIRSSVRQVEKPGDLSLFANFFEAFMGFYRLHGPSN
ncbi:MAG: type III-A CRISPR-associated protein Csm2 [Desulfobacterales bacterium]|nr:type III-A CRISPR-associated protein Csm2 [Desulfobacterales bacterium]